MNVIISEESLNRKDHYNEIINYMPHRDKVTWAKNKIKDFLNYCIENNQKFENKQINEITVSFSGGKDSTVLLDLVLKVHAELNCNIYIVPAYAVEITFPSTIRFIKKIIEEYKIQYKYLKEPLLINPKLPWNEILNLKGYPIYSKQISVLINRVKNAKTKNCLTKWFFGIDVKNTNTSKYKLSKPRIFLLDDYLKTHWPEMPNDEMLNYFKKYNEFYFYSEKCCDFVKGGLKHDLRPSFIGVTTEESEMRKKSWIQFGCNIYNRRALKSRPLSIWKSSDVWQYIDEHKLSINPAYKYDNTLAWNSQELDFQRLGCTSCPFGSSIEQRKIKILKQNQSYPINSNQLKNRFELLKTLYPSLYTAQVIHTGMYRVLIDMKIEINNDALYMQLYALRWQQIDQWYDQTNFRTNILRILAQIENPNDYKCKGDGYIWNYSIDEVNEALNYFDIIKHTTQKEFSQIRMHEQAKSTKTLK